MPAVKYTKWPINFSAHTVDSWFCVNAESSQKKIKEIKKIRSGVGVALKNISSTAPSFYRWKMRTREGRGLTQDHTASNR